MYKINLLFMVESMKAGGAERQLHEIMTGLSRDYFNVRLLTWVPGDVIFKPISYKWDQCNRKSKFDLSPIFKAAQLLRMGEVDIIHGFLDTGNLYAVIARMLAGKGIALASERSSHRKLTILQKFHKPWSHRMATLTISNSKIGKVYLQELGISSGKVQIVPNGVDTEIFKPIGKQSVNLTKSSLGLDPDRGVILAVGRIAPVKNQLEIVKAYANSVIKKSHDLVLVGDSSCVYLEQTKLLISNLDLGNRVKIFGAREDIHLFYKVADVLTLFSTREGTPNVVLEAMSCAIPCVVSDVGDCSTYVKDSHTGWLVPSTDVKSLHAVFEEIAATDKIRLVEMGANGLRLLHELQVDKASMIGNFEKLYQSLMEGKK